MSLISANVGKSVLECATLFISECGNLAIYDIAINLVRKP